MLQVSELRAAYGSVPVLNGVSLSVARGEVLALLGRNGVGKTTLLRALTGLLPSLSGRVQLDGTAVERMAPHRIARLGMSLVPQGRGILGKLTVAENLIAGMRAAVGRPPLTIEEALEPFPALLERLEDRGSTLSGGQQQQLAIARALCGRPRVMLLDEPSEGVQPNIVQGISRLIKQLCSNLGISVLLVEQNIELALQTATRCLVMEKGRIVHEGPPDELRKDSVLKKYLAI
jgi:urea ABC transporter ATP-binding protein UrtE